MAAEGRTPLRLANKGTKLQQDRRGEKPLWDWHTFSWESVSRVASSELQPVHSWRLQKAKKRVRLFTMGGLDQAGGSSRQMRATGSVFRNPS